MALTEASVLSDVIQIVQHQQKYVALNQVVVPPITTTTPAYQYITKKRALGVGAEILRKGMDSLCVSSTDREREFHRAIALLRQRWRLKRVGSGMIVGDLSYRSGKERSSFPLFLASVFLHSSSCLFSILLTFSLLSSILQLHLPRNSLII